jgi:hypothetical protein
MAASRLSISLPHHQTETPERELGMGLMSMLQLLPCVLLAALPAIHVAYVLLRRRNPKQPREESSSSSRRSSLPAAPPGAAGLPLIGNAVTFFELLRRNPHRALARLAGTYGPIFSFRPGRTCAFVVLSSRRWPARPSPRRRPLWRRGSCPTACAPWATARGPWPSSRAPTRCGSGTAPRRAPSSPPPGGSTRSGASGTATRAGSLRA